MESQKLTLPLREMSSLHAGESTDKRQKEAGYASDASGKSNKPISTSQRFNSKVYAQKQIGSLIGERQNTVGKVYVANVLNMGVDTRDLAPQRSMKTQWRGKHFDPEWDAKELAKVKHFKEAGVQSNMEATSAPARKQPSFKIREEGTLAGTD